MRIGTLPPRLSEVPTMFDPRQDDSRGEEMARALCASLARPFTFRRIGRRAALEILAATFGIYTGE